LKKPGNWFGKEFTYNMVMIHSKVVVIDPFGKNPGVMTGSHSLGPKASGKNDDNLLTEHSSVPINGFTTCLIKSAKGPKTGSKSSPQYDGNFDDDEWQDRYTGGVNLREIEFWLSLVIRVLRETVTVWEAPGMFRKYKVDLFLSGHDHSLQHLEFTDVWTCAQAWKKHAACSWNRISKP
jgi:hypothetical protein